MPRKRGIELIGDLAQLGKACPRHSGKVVVLVVITDIVGHDIERPVVAVCLRDGNLVVRVGCFRGYGLIYVVLGDEVTRSGVKRSGQEG